MSDKTVQEAVAGCHEMRSKLDTTMAAAVEQVGQDEAGQSAESAYDPDEILLSLLRQRGPEGLPTEDLMAGLRSPEWKATSSVGQPLRHQASHYCG